MSDPRMIPAHEARETLEETINPTTNLSWSGDHVRDLAYTVVRLRAELVELRDYYRRREAESQSRVDAATTDLHRLHAARFTHNHKRTHEALTRILEGHAE